MNPRQKRWAVIGITFLIVVCSFRLASLPIAKWLLARWQNHTPLPGVRLTLKTLAYAGGGVELQLNGAAPILVPFNWRWNLFPPSVSLRVKERWRELAAGPNAVLGPMVDAEVLLPFWGEWKLKGDFGANGLLAGSNPISLGLEGNVLLSPSGGSGRISLLKEKTKHFADWTISNIHEVPLLLNLSCGEKLTPCAARKFGRGVLQVGSVQSLWKINLNEEPGQFLVTGSVSGIRPANFSALENLPPFVFSGVLTAKGNLRGAGDFTWSLGSPDFPWTARGQGSTQDWQHGHATVELPVIFQTEVPLPAWLKKVAPGLDGLGGKIVASASADWKGNGARVTSRMLSSGVTGEWNEIPFSLGKVQISGELYPRVRSLGENQIQVTSVGKKVPFENASIRLSWKAATSVAIAEGRAQFAGGTLRLEPFAWAISRGRAASRVFLENAELSLLAPLVFGENAQGSGKLSGVIPWSLENGDLEIDNGVIRNEQPGRLSYRDQSTVHLKEKIEFLDEFNDLLAQGQQMLVLKALHDFHFSLLRLTLNRKRDTNMWVGLELKGYNPNLAKGQPFEISLPITGQIEPLIRETVMKAFLGR